MLLKGVSVNLVILLLLSLAYEPPMPVGISGRVLINGIPAEGIEVHLKNLNTGEEKTAITQENGWYACAMSGANGHKIQGTVIYNGKEYKKTVIVDLDRTTQFLNFSIQYEETPPSGGGGEGGGTTSPPPQESSPSPPPSPPPLRANFTYFPENPKVGEEVTFTDTSEGMIMSRTWTIDGKTFDTETVRYTFTSPGNYTISLVVMDAEGNLDIHQKTIYVAPIPEQNKTENYTQPQPQKNITLFIEVKDKEGNPLRNARVEIYQNETLLQITYTNSTGIAEVSVPPGSYKLRASYGNQIKTKRMSFVNDGRVVFLFSPEQRETRHEQFNYLFLIPVLAIVVILIVVILRRRKPWWK